MKNENGGTPLPKDGWPSMVEGFVVQTSALTARLSAVEARLSAIELRLKLRGNIPPPASVKRKKSIAAAIARAWLEIMTFGELASASDILRGARKHPRLMRELEKINKEFDMRPITPVRIGAWLASIAELDLGGFKFAYVRAGGRTYWTVEEVEEGSK